MNLFFHDALNPASLRTLFFAGLTLLYFGFSLRLIYKIVTQKDARVFYFFSHLAFFLILGFYFLSLTMYLDFWMRYSQFREITNNMLAFLPAVFFINFRQFSQVIGRHAARKSFAELDGLKDRFYAMASHEFRTPITVISGFAEVLALEKLGELNEVQKERLRKILHQGKKLNGVMNTLLDLASVRSGKVALKREPFVLAPLLKKCYSEFRPLCAQSRIDFLADFGDGMPAVLGDSDRASQMASHLLSNAVKYSKAGGKITLRSYEDKRNGVVRIEIKDEGVGIHSDDQKKIFEEFYRVEHPEIVSRNGAGLGLALVKCLAESQGGEVGVHSRGIGQGSLFYFTLPTAKTASKTVKAAA